MRSEVIFRATETIANKYKLCQTVSKATRRLHIASGEMNETINIAFLKIAADRELPMPIDMLELPSKTSSGIQQRSMGSPFVIV
jgi:hypothetical protein